MTNGLLQRPRAKRQIPRHDYQGFCHRVRTIKEASYQIRKREISQYPVFVFARQAVQLGSLLINADELDIQWHVFASYLEILTQQGIVDPEKIEDFQGTWKNPDEFCCLFVVDEEFTNFVYIPYPED